MVSSVLNIFLKNKSKKKSQKMRHEEIMRGGSVKAAVWEGPRFSDTGRHGCSLASHLLVAKAFPGLALAASIPPESRERHI